MSPAGSRSRKGGFTLIELMIVVAIVAIIAAIAIPSLLNSRKAANEASAINTMRTLTTVSQQYRTRFGAWPADLATLSTAGFIDEVLGAGTKTGYIFVLAPFGTDSYSVNADPSEPGATGDRYFFVEQSGVIRFSNSGPADLASPPVD